MAEPLPDIEIQANISNTFDTKQRSLMVLVSVPEAIIRRALEKQGITQASVDNPEGRYEVFQRACDIDDGVKRSLARYLRRTVAYHGDTVGGDHKLATIEKIGQQQYVFSLADSDVINHLGTLAREANAPLEIVKGTAFRRAKISPRRNPDVPQTYAEFEFGIRRAIIEGLGLQDEYPLPEPARVRA